jgi:hypothetical protein
MQLPVARPHFEANKPKLGDDSSDAHEELLSRVHAVPRRQNFDASDKPRLGGEPAASERGDVLDKMGSVPRRKNFGAPKLGGSASADEEAEERAVFAAMGRVPPRANFSADKLGGQGTGAGGGGMGDDLLFSSMDKVPRRKNFEGMGKGLSVSDADEHSTAINSMPEIKRGAFNPGALGANGGGHSDGGMKRASDLPVRASFNPGASYTLSPSPILCFSRLFAHPYSPQEWEAG